MNLFHIYKCHVGVSLIVQVPPDFSLILSMSFLMPGGNTQHFCRFLKTREAKKVLARTAKTRKTCLFCNTIISSYNGDAACFSCQDKLRNRELSREEQLAVLAEGQTIKFKERLKDYKIQATFYRECEGICAGNGQTIFGEIIPKKNMIVLGKTKSISVEGKCGNCGGKIRIFRDLMPDWAKSFRVVLWHHNNREFADSP